MAIVTPNGPKANKGEVSQILNFIKDLLPKSLVKAISLLLHPCCTISGTGIATCFDYNKFNLTITLDKPLPASALFPEYNITAISFGSVMGVGVGTYIAPNTITVPMVFTGGVTNVTQDVAIALAYPTSTDTSVGVYQRFIVPDVVFNGGPCD